MGSETMMDVKIQDLVKSHSLSRPKGNSDRRGGSDTNRDEGTKANKENKDCATNEPVKADEVASVEVEALVLAEPSRVVFSDMDLSIGSRSYFVDEKVNTGYQVDFWTRAGELLVEYESDAGVLPSAG
ncbi:hypothetical protein ACOSQ4_029268 [Xanthoceras sorbifolium]